MQTLQMPAMPDPARVTLDPKTTALMVLDYVEDICDTQPKCKSQMLPAMTPFMERVRKAGLDRGIRHPRAEHDQMAEGGRAGRGRHQDREHGPGQILQHRSRQALKAKGITTIIMVGWKISGSVTYTSVGAMIRDYTVVIPVDTTAAATDYETAIGFYNVLNSGNANLTNQPLKPKSVTLSRTDLITFQ